jgi:hypothetical protein
VGERARLAIRQGTLPARALAYTDNTSDADTTDKTDYNDTDDTTNTDDKDHTNTINTNDTDIITMSTRRPTSTRSCTMISSLCR